MKKEILTTHDRVRKCSYCENKILKGEEHFRFQHTTYRASLTIDICVICLKNELKKINNKKYKEIAKRYESEGILKELIK